jgi:integrase
MTSVNITRRVWIEGKGLRFCKVIRGGNGKIRPNVVLIDGEERPVSNGLYYLDFIMDGKRTRRAAGSTAAEATQAAERQEAELVGQKAATKLFAVRTTGTAEIKGAPEIRHALRAAGIVLSEPEVKGVLRKDALRDAVASYLLEIKTHKKPKTHEAYATALRYFLESCHKASLEAITRADLLTFRSYLKAKGQSDRSQFNNFMRVMIFLKQNQITGLAKKNDWPTFVEEEVSVFTDEELKKFGAACDEQESLWFKFFYVTAMREQEVMHASWDDIDFENKTATVRENKQWGFKPKAYKGRLIPLTTELVDLLKVWKKQSDPACGLIFSRDRSPRPDFLDTCKAVAKRAGLTDFYLHKFRATRATHLLQNGMDIKSVQRILGHTDLQSTMRYLGVQRVDVLQAQVERMGSRF